MIRSAVKYYYPTGIVRGLSARSFTGNSLVYLPNGATEPDSDDFAIYPDFFSLSEQSTLLGSALRKLDSKESRQSRRMRQSLRGQASVHAVSDPLFSLFLADDLYEFEDCHFDGVISGFREMHVSSWPEADICQLQPLLDRLRSLHPPVETQTHLLHLSSDGQILPHIDNTSASGSWILGVSLGATRVMRMEPVFNDRMPFDVLLPSGSVYLQKDSVRFNYKHSILRNGIFRNEVLNGGQRLSIMIRDIKSVALSELQGLQC